MLPRLAEVFSKGCIHSLNISRSFEPSTSLALYLVVAKMQMFHFNKTAVGVVTFTVRQCILVFFGVHILKDKQLYISILCIVCSRLKDQL